MSPASGKQTVNTETKDLSVFCFEWPQTSRNRLQLLQLLVQVRIRLIVDLYGSAQWGVVGIGSDLFQIVTEVATLLVLYKYVHKLAPFKLNHNFVDCSCDSKSLNEYIRNLPEVLRFCNRYNCYSSRISGNVNEVRGYREAPGEHRCVVVACQIHNSQSSRIAGWTDDGTDIRFHHQLWGKTCSFGLLAVIEDIDETEVHKVTCECWNFPTWYQCYQLNVPIGFDPLRFQSQKLMSATRPKSPYPETFRSLQRVCESNGTCSIVKYCLIIFAHHHADIHSESISSDHLGRNIRK